MSDQQQTCAYHYTVKRGDSFYLISQRLSVALRDLLEANPNIPPARLTVGDVLCIPYCNNADTPAADQNNSCPVPQDGSGSCNEETMPSDQPTPYVCAPNRRAVVQNNQTASDLQLRYNLSYHTLKTANSDKNLDALKGGDVICLPETNIACPLPATVTMGNTDTLETLSQRYKITVADLLKANPCLAPQDFKPGVTVLLPD